MTICDRPIPHDHVCRQHLGLARSPERGKILPGNLGSRFPHVDAFRVEASLRQQLAEKDREIADLRKQIKHLKGKL